MGVEQHLIHLPHLVPQLPEILYLFHGKRFLITNWLKHGANGADSSARHDLIPLSSGVRDRGLMENQVEARVGRNHDNDVLLIGQHRHFLLTSHCDV